MKQIYKERERKKRKSLLDIHLPGSLCAAEFLFLGSVRHFCTFMTNLSSLNKIHLDLY